MVLARYIALAGLALSIGSGCIDRARPRLPEKRIPVTVVVANESNAPRFIESPRELTDGLTRALRERGLEPKFVPPYLFEEEMRSRRTTQARLRIAARQGNSRVPSDLVLLIETESSFYSELEGRFRWTVEVKASFIERKAIGKPVQSSFSAPAILVFPHYRGSRALAYVAEPVARSIGELAGEFIDEQGSR